jgi:hypothetical protein
MNARRVLLAVPLLRRMGGTLTVLGLLFAVGAPRAAIAEIDRGEGAAHRANEFIVAMEYDKARSELDAADPASPSVMTAKARLALYEEDCDLAVAILGRTDVVLSEEARALLEVAQGCARVIAATLSDRDEASGVIVRWHDDNDRALLPLIVETVEKARVSLTHDLGVQWKRPLRITVVRDLLSLSAMTGLPYKSAQTTGTVAVAKWGRVTLLSPRASHHGFPWRDTLAHEMTHLAISKESLDRAPLWLQEGVARREETRWRPPGPFDDRPNVDTVVLKGLELKLDLPLDKLGPSIAMLPSAEAATVAFAEVTSFVRFFVETQGDGALGQLLVVLRTARSVDEALRQLTGETLAQWDIRWRAALAKKPKEALSPLYGLGGSLPSGGETRERARLAELLMGRDHAAEASLETAKIPESLMGDPSLRYLVGRVLESKGEPSAAAALVEEPSAWVSSFGPCWALRGKLARNRGDRVVAEASILEALGHDPFSVESACSLQDAYSLLCEAAHVRNEPDLGRD